MNAPRWCICTLCGGDGDLDALGVVNPDDFDEEDWVRYQAGAYRRPCGACGGAGKVRANAAAPIVRLGKDGQPAVYEDANDASEHFLRMAEGRA